MLVLLLVPVKFLISLNLLTYSWETSWGINSIHYNPKNLHSVRDGSQTLWPHWQMCLSSLCNLSFRKHLWCEFTELHTFIYTGHWHMQTGYKHAHTHTHSHSHTPTNWNILYQHCSSNFRDLTVGDFWQQKHRDSGVTSWDTRSQTFLPHEIPRWKLENSLETHARFKF